MIGFNALTLFHIIIGIYFIIIFMVILILYTFTKSLSYNRLASKKKEWNKLIDDEIFSHIFEGKDTVNPDLLKLMKSDVFQEFFIKKLISALNSFSGNYNGTIIKIFELYHLNQFSEKKLNNKNPFIIAQGIQELSAMQSPNILKKLEKLIYHPNQVVQDEAQFGLVEILKFDGLYFLNNLQTNLTQWQQIRLLSTLQNVPLNYETEFNSWLKSNNPSVVIFTLKIIQKFQLFKHENVLLKILNNPNHSIINQVIKSFSSVNSITTADNLIEFFPYQNLENQLEILTVIERITEPHHQHFLIEEVVHHPNISIKKKAIKALLTIISLEEIIKKLSTTDNHTKLILDQIILENK